MSFMNSLKVFLGFEEEEQLKPEEKVDRPILIKEEKSEPKGRKASLIDFQKVKKGDQNIADLSTEMVIIDPRTYEDSTEISCYIKEGKPVVVNLKYLDAQEGKRLLDFVCGTVYAFEGNMQKLGGNIFLFTPRSMSIIDRKDTETGADYDEFGFPKRGLETGAHQEQPLEQSDMFAKAAIA